MVDFCYWSTSVLILFKANKKKVLLIFLPVNALIIKVIVSVQQQYKLIIIILHQHWIFVKCFQNIQGMSRMLRLAVMSYLKEIYNLFGKFCSDSVLSFKIWDSNKCLFIFILWSFSTTALCLPLSGADISVLSVINWSQRLGKKTKTFFWHTLLSFRDTLHLKSNLVLPLAKKR